MPRAPAAPPSSRASCGYSYACEGGAAGDVELLFGGTTYEGTMKGTFRGPHGVVTITQRFKGKRLGDC